MTLEKLRNLVEIDYWRLGYLAQYMVKLSKDKDRQVIKTKDEVVEILNRYKGNKIVPDKVKEKLKQNLNW